MALVVLLASRAASAVEDGCQSPKTTYDRTYCTAKLFVESDNELNAVYKELKKSLGNDAQKKLTAVQREWITHRDGRCEAGGTINVQCNYDVNRARVEFLRDRLRECKTGHCRDDLVGQKSW
jgi:uncharacterized protein YecT (DUF1311 family)